MAAVVLLWVGLWSCAAWAFPFAYILNTSDLTVSVIDTATNTVAATVFMEGHLPNGLAVTPDGTRVYVPDLFGFVRVIDTSINAVVDNVSVGTSPSSVVVTPAGTRAYVANGGSANVSVIDTASNTVVATVSVGLGARGMAVNPNGTRVYVTNFGDGTVSVIDTATNAVVATVTVENVNGDPNIGPLGVAVNPAGTRVYVANRGPASVQVIDTATNTVVATVAVGTSLNGVAVNPAGTRVYVTNGTNPGTLSVIDTATNTVVATVPLENVPGGVGVTPDGTRAYVVNGGSANVSVIDTASNTVVATVPVGRSPSASGIFIAPSVLRLSAHVNQFVFAIGHALTTTVGLTNPGLAGATDVYVGLLLPDGDTIVFFTGTGIAVGRLGNLASFEPIGSGVPLVTPFEVTRRSFFTYRWTGSEPHGDYVFFVLALKASALTGGGLAGDAILGLATAPLSFP